MHHAHVLSNLDFSLNQTDSEIGPSGAKVHCLRFSRQRCACVRVCVCVCVCARVRARVFMCVCDCVYARA